MISFLTIFAFILKYIFFVYSLFYIYIICSFFVSCTVIDLVSIYKTSFSLESRGDSSIQQSRLIIIRRGHLIQETTENSNYTIYHKQCTGLIWPGLKTHIMAIGQ